MPSLVEPPKDRRHQFFGLDSDCLSFVSGQREQVKGSLRTFKIFTTNWAACCWVVQPSLMLTVQANLQTGHGSTLSPPPPEHSSLKNKATPHSCHPRCVRRRWHSWQRCGCFVAESLKTSDFCTSLVLLSPVPARCCVLSVQDLRDRKISYYTILYCTMLD